MAPNVIRFLYQVIMNYRDNNASELEADKTESDQVEKLEDEHEKL